MNKALATDQRENFSLPENIAKGKIFRIQVLLKS
jgi:hypothetical protein